MSRGTVPTPADEAMVLRTWEPCGIMPIHRAQGRVTDLTVHDPAVLARELAEGIGEIALQAVGRADIQRLSLVGGRLR